jgi:hypothetical protein
MKEIIMALMIWIGANTDYNIDISNPTVYFLTQEKMEKVYYGDKEHLGITLHGFYDIKSKLIVLPETWDKTDPWHLSVLLHEIIHYLQDKNDILFVCMAEMEKDTWPLQQKYLKEVHNVNWEYDALWYMVISTCNPD